MESDARTEVKTMVLDVIEVDQTINTTQFLDARDWIAEQIQKAIGGPYLSVAQGKKTQRIVAVDCNTEG